MHYITKMTLHYEISCCSLFFSGPLNYEGEVQKEEKCKPHHWLLPHATLYLCFMFMLARMTLQCFCMLHWLIRLHYFSSWQMMNMTSLTERWIWMNQQISLIYTGTTNLQTAFSPHILLPTFHCPFHSQWEVSDQVGTPLQAWTPSHWSGIMTMTLAETWRRLVHRKCTLRKKMENKRRTSTWEEQQV